jgi:hypothetical protein
MHVFWGIPRGFPSLSHTKAKATKRHTFPYFAVPVPVSVFSIGDQHPGVEI